VGEGKGVSDISGYFERIGRLLSDVQVTDGHGAAIGLDVGIERVIERIRRIGVEAKKVVLVGNGGSAAIAGHMEMDLCNRVGVRAHVFNDPPVLTALANDYGYQTAFERMVRLWIEPDDCLVAISSSGQSENIHRAVHAARARGGSVVTFSGFRADNPLRAMGDCNFYVASDHYGEVEVAHHVLGHYLTDAAAESRGR
jgi:D-sedoheptulose 7-phosphate isomerase